MRKVITALLLSTVFGIAHAESDKNQLFECMDAKTLEMNSQCITDKISNNVEFREMQSKITQDASVNSDYVVATMKFYPQKMLIEIVAHKDALLSKSEESRINLAKR